MHIVDKNQTIHWMECNPRFGGASNAGISMGLNVWRWSIKELIDDKYSPAFKRKRSEIVQAKSINDHVFSVDDRYMKLDKKLVDSSTSKKELEKIVLCDVPTVIYPELEKAFLNLIHNSGHPGIKLEKKIDFNKLYNERFN